VTAPPGSAVVHASAVSFGPERGVLIEGPSGSGKSGLALGLIAAGAQLVADDRTVLFATDGKLFARPPRPIAGLVEARGLGILRLTACRLARIRLVIQLVAADTAARLPEPAHTTRLGCDVFLLRADPGAAFAQALARAIQSAKDEQCAVSGLWSVPR
jgi:HPr kinase/phosphorylase